MKPKDRPTVLDGLCSCYSLACGNVYVTVNFLNGEPFEVFASLGKAGGCSTAQLESICRLTSLSLRSGVSYKFIASQLENIICPGEFWENGNKNHSCPDVIAKALRGLADSYKEAHPTPPGLGDEEKSP